MADQVFMQIDIEQQQYVPVREHISVLYEEEVRMFPCGNMTNTLRPAPKTKNTQNVGQKARIGETTEASDGYVPLHPILAAHQRSHGGNKPSTRRMQISCSLLIAIRNVAWVDWNHRPRPYQGLAVLSVSREFIEATKGFEVVCNREFSCLW
jgi:hypothetical protein